MPWTCRPCGSAVAEGAPCCPECRSTDLEGRDMPRATVEGGASDYAADAAPADGDQPAIEVPSARAPKAELVDAAVTHAGLDPDEAAALTKAELMETITAAVPPPPPPPGN